MRNGQTPRGVVFDLDGTLVDSMDLMPQVYADTIRRLGGPVVTGDDIVAVWNRGPTPVLLSHFLQRSVSKAEVAVFYDNLDAAMVHLQAFDGVREMLEHLIGHGYRVGVFTHATRRAATMALQVTRLSLLISAMVCGEDVEHGKPHPEGLRKACGALDVTAQDAAYVGDAPADMACAVQAGCLAVHAAWDARVALLWGTHLTAQHPSDVPRCVGA